MTVVTRGVLKFSAKKLFFKTDYVKELIGKQSAKALGKAGAFVRTRARGLLRRRKKPSAVGQPPSVHSESDVATLKNIWFALDEQSKSVVVGPLALNQVNMTANGSTTVPAIHEFGGDVQIHEYQYKVKLGSVVTPSQLAAARNQQWYRADLRRAKRPWLRYRVRQAHYPPRPFMWPALQAEAPKFPQLWFRESLSGWRRGAA